MNPVSRPIMSGKRDGRFARHSGSHSFNTSAEAKSLVAQRTLLSQRSEKGKKHACQALLIPCSPGSADPLSFDLIARDGKDEQDPLVSLSCSLPSSFHPLLLL